MDGCWKRFWRLCRIGEAAYDPVSGDWEEPFSLPSPIPEWPKGKGFADGNICLGEIEVVRVANLERIWSCRPWRNKSKGAAFYKPVSIPDGFFCLGHYAQSTDRPFRGFLLAAREVPSYLNAQLSPLQKPIDYTLIFCPQNLIEANQDGPAFFWLPCPPEGYRALGIVVTRDSSKPSVEDVRCVRADLTARCEAYHPPILSVRSRGSYDGPFTVWTTRPSVRGMWSKGVPVGAFLCTADGNDMINGGEDSICCLKNLDPYLSSMPNLEQIHALIRHYGPTVFFHQEELYLPSAVPWFFENGAALYKKGGKEGLAIDADGSNLPAGGDNDGEYWIDFLEDFLCDRIKRGFIDSAKIYVHAKPSLGGTFTDLAMWVFYPFNGPSRLKIGPLSIPLGKIGQHVGDWEHFTLRISNFAGEIWSVYFAQHSGGEWVDAPNLEFTSGNRPAVFSSRNGHASFPSPGTRIQGSEKLAIGIRNDAARGGFFLDSSVNYLVIAAEYLGDAVDEPCWLQFMGEWGPTIEYGFKLKLEKILRFLPRSLRSLAESAFYRLPRELFGEEGPTGPKQKEYWAGDERS